jgi:S1-C subfamily serine protease
VKALVAVIAALTLAPAAGAAKAPPKAPPANGAATLQSQLIGVVKKVAPSVVQIETSSGLGSGVIFDRAGHIVTNAHVVAGATKVKVTLASGKPFAGTVVSSFTAGDLAVVKIAAPNLRPIAVAPSSKLQVGAFALAIGNPLGLRSSVTFGIVSALHRTVTEGQGISIPDTIQTSAQINPGNSGGALVDVLGRLIGIPTLAATNQEIGGQAPGIGFAIPSDTVKDIASQIIEHGKVVDSHRAYIGVGVSDTLGGEGVFVTSVESGSPAAKAGIQQGDVIASIAGKATPTVDALSEVLAGFKPGQSAKIRLVRQSGAAATVRVTFASSSG